MGEDRPGHPERADEVHVELAAQLLGGVRLGDAEVHPAGVVDHRVQRLDLREGLADGGVHGVLPGDVQGQDPQIVSALLGEGHEPIAGLPVPPFRVPHGGEDVVTPGGQLPCDVVADAAAASGDEDGGQCRPLERTGKGDGRPGPGTRESQEV